MNWKFWRRNIGKELVDSQVHIVPFIIHIEKLWDYVDEDGRKEILRLKQLWLNYGRRHK